MHTVLLGADAAAPLRLGTLAEDTRWRGWGRMGRMDLGPADTLAAFPAVQVLSLALEG